MYTRAVRHEEAKGTLTTCRAKGARAAQLEFTVALRRATCSNVYTKQSSLPAENGTLIQIKRDYNTDTHRYDFSYLHPREAVLTLCKPKSNSAPRPGDQLIADAERCTKLKALRSDLEQLRREEPSMHAVVFTHCTVRALSCGLDPMTCLGYALAPLCLPLVSLLPASARSLVPRGGTIESSVIRRARTQRSSNV